jgi:hypothetical protein
MELFYCMTAAEDAERVRATGLVAGRAGTIRLFTELAAANAIARDVLRLKRYAVFSVAAGGIRAKLRPDRAKGLTSRCQRRVPQRRIDPQHLRLVGLFDTITSRPTEWDYQEASREGISRPSLDALYEAREWAREQCRTGRLTEEQIAAELARRWRAALDDGAKPPDQT